MIHTTEENKTIKVHLPQALNRNNILSIKEDILQSIPPDTKALEFYFEEVDEIDSPAMAIMVVIMKYLSNMKIFSKVKGLSGESLDLATCLGLHYIAEVENKI